MRPEWSVWARSDRDAIFDSIETDNRRAAVAIDRRISERIETLRQHP